MYFSICIFWLLIFSSSAKLSFFSLPVLFSASNEFLVQLVLNAIFYAWLTASGPLNKYVSIPVWFFSFFLDFYPAIHLQMTLTQFRETSHQIYFSFFVFLAPTFVWCSSTDVFGFKAAKMMKESLKVRISS
jgi:hypothetical protein